MTTSLPVKNCERGVDLNAFMADIGDYGRSINDTAACPLFRTYNAYNFPQQSDGLGYHRFQSKN